jgi:hypothetical protein
MWFENHRLFAVIFVYIILYGMVIWFQPEMIYDSAQSQLRTFGVGYKNTTILPLWLTSILLAILSYFIVLYVLHARYNSIFIRA